MPVEAPEQFQNEPFYSLWRDMSRMVEDSGSIAFVAVAGEIITRLEDAETNTEGANKGARSF